MAEMIKPIETVYNGYRFRSRLEARWAVFFDALGVQYEYEPEGFTKNGITYLPDFRLKCYGFRGEHNWEDPIDLYVEVKGKMDEESAKKINTFTPGESWTERNGNWERVKCGIHLLVVGSVPKDIDMMDIDNDMGYGIFAFNYDTIDGDYFGAFPAADSSGKFYLFGDDSNYINQEDVPRVKNALLKARQARFEHGECG